MFKAAAALAVPTFIVFTGGYLVITYIAKKVS
jgi:hypothetical protein